MLIENMHKTKKSRNTCFSKLFGLNIRIALMYLMIFFICIIPTMKSNTANATRLKDIITMKGVRQNQLIGYGLVVGLAGTGDGSSSTFTVQSLASLLSGMGITLDADEIKVKNVAAVMVTANLPPFSRIGSKIDVIVSSTGDAKSLVGGTLLLTPLRAPNGDVYAVAQGPVTIGGFASSSGGASIVQNHVTAGRIPGGALVEKEVAFELNNKESLEFSLRISDFTTAVRIEEGINERLASDIAKAKDSGTIIVKIPTNFKDKVPELLALIEDLDIEIDSVAKVVLNERTGTVVLGDKVRISKVAIAHGNLTLQIETTSEVYQPSAFTKADTVVVPQTQVKAEETGSGATPGSGEKPKLRVVEGATIGELVGALNALGVSPRDLITILQAIRSAGALQAEIELM